MRTIELLAQLRTLRVKIWADGERLRYTAPKDALTPELLAQLVAHKADILAFLQKATVEKLSSPPIQPAVREGPLPLSFAQQRLWFLDQLAPGRPGYNIPTAFRLHGRLDYAALQRSLDTIISRHEALRTTFIAVDGQPAQVIAPPAPFCLAHLDLSALPAAEREATAQREVLAEAQRPFDLARGPLVRAILLRLDAAEHLALFTLHHIISDGWSIGVLIRELVTLYPAYINGQPMPLPELPIQYADYTIWQRQWLQGEALERQLAYWRVQLGGDVPVLDLPIARARPSAQTFVGTTRSFKIAPDLDTALRALSQRTDTTLFMTLLTAFQILLHRYSGQTDILIGSPIANRTRVDLERLIGFFVNTLVLRVDLAGNPTVRELLGRVREVTLQAYAHQDVPFERLVEELRPERDLSRTPLFQVMFVLQNAEVVPLELPGLTLSPQDNETGTAKFDMVGHFAEGASGLLGTVEYNTDLFDHPVIERLIAHFQVLMAGMVANIDQRIGELPLLTASEREQILITWNATNAERPVGCVHQLVEQQVARTPDAIAVELPATAAASSGRAESSSLTYRELNARANQLAQRLRSLGVGPDVRVGLCLQRSLDLVIGMLGILKAGAAYVPLDPAYPAERLAFMLADARCPVLVTAKEPDTEIGRQGDKQMTDLLVSLSPGLGRIVDLRADWPLIAQQPATNPASGVSAENLAYVIYTSGSTGRPKGIAMPHRALANLLAWQLRSFRLAPAARTVQFASASFDVSFQEIFSTWCAGGLLVLLNDDLRRDPAALLGFLNETAVARLFVPFVALQQLAEVIDERGLRPATLREVITAGEQLRITQPIARWLGAGDGVVLHNHYGPSETHAITAFTLQGSPQDWPTLPPIGRPLANTQIYLLDARMQPVPVGVPGELYAGGVNLVRGYLDRPDLTAERFVPNPFAMPEDVETQNIASLPHYQSTRLYKTGDLARYLPDGTIAFLGRADSQVKVRGYRIEPGEVEAIMTQHPAVREAVVIVRPDTSGTNQLVGYIVTMAPAEEQKPVSADAHASALIGELRSFMQARMPSYMVPAMIVPLAAWPLTPSGKIDRRALPAINEIRVERQDTYLAPRDTTELALIRIWEDLLGVQSVGVRDNFFDLGGHSLLVVRLISRIQKHFGYGPPLSALFQNPTVEHLAHMLRQQNGALPHTSLVGLQPDGANRPFFCVHPGAGNILCYVELAQRLGTAQPFYGLQAAGLEGEQAPRSTVAAMATAYLAALRAVQPQGPYLLGGWSFGGIVAYEMAQQLHAQGQTVALLALIDSGAPTPDDTTTGDDVTLLAWFAHDLGRMFGKTSPLTTDDLRRIAPGQRLRYVLDQARAANILPQDIDEQQITHALAVFAANLQAMQRYQPQPYAGRVTLFRAGTQAADAVDPTLGWDALAAEGVALHVIPGDHYSIVRPPQVHVLAEQLHACLEAAQAGAADRADQSQLAAQVLPT